MIALPNYPNGGLYYIKLLFCYKKNGIFNLFLLAMENWGLITYRETALFFSDDSNSLSNKQSVATIIAHELAHFVYLIILFCNFTLQS